MRMESNFTQPHFISTTLIIVCLCVPGSLSQSSGCSTSSSTGKCQQCSGSVCVKCGDGYRPVGSSCSACISNCKSCTSSSGCTTCKDGYYFYSYYCSTCSTGCSSCATYSGATSTCDTCSSGYYKYSSYPSLCASCYTGCSTCTGSSKSSCTSCKSGYRLASGQCNLKITSAAAAVAGAFGGFFVLVILIVIYLSCKSKKTVTRVNPQNQHKGVPSVMGNVNFLSLVSKNNSARPFTSSPIYTQPTFSAQTEPTYTPPHRYSLLRTRINSPISVTLLLPPPSSILTRVTR